MVKWLKSFKLQPKAQPQRSVDPLQTARVNDHQQSPNNKLNGSSNPIHQAPTPQISSNNNVHLSVYLFVTNSDTSHILDRWCRGSGVGTGAHVS